MRLFKPASSEGGQKSCRPAGSPKSRVFENRQNTLGSLTFPKPSVSWGWGISSNWSFFQTTPNLKPHKISGHTKSQTTPNSDLTNAQATPNRRRHQFSDHTNSQATPIVRPHQLSGHTNSQATPPTAAAAAPISVLHPPLPASRHRRQCSQVL